MKDREKTNSGSAAAMRERSLKSRHLDWYGGGAFSIERHTTEILGGTKGFSCNTPTGRIGQGQG
jgi:hypothetical protein